SILGPVLSAPLATLLRETVEKGRQGPATPDKTSKDWTREAGMAIDRSAPANGQSRGDEREKALDMALAQIEKHFGKGSIMRLGDNTAVGVDVLHTGAIGLVISFCIGRLSGGR